MSIGTIYKNSSANDRIFGVTVSEENRVSVS